MDKARNVARNASESARSFGRSAFQASNLLPAALIGAGVYWLKRNWGEGNGYEYEKESDERHGRVPVHGLRIDPRLRIGFQQRRLSRVWI